jgi:phosphomevalonate kinase
MNALAEIAHAADDAVRAADAGAFVEAVAASGPALQALGAAAGAPIVPAAFAALGVAARAERAAFVPSGAGGGDVAVFVGMTGPSASFLLGAERAGMKRLSLGVDRRGVHLSESSIRNPS